MSKACEEWHRIVRERDVDALDQLLADDVVFHSPVVHTPQHGRPLTTMYLAAAVMVLDIEAVQLQHERSVAEQAFVLVAAVPALAPEQLLIPAAARRNVGDRDQRLRVHRRFRV